MAFLFGDSVGHYAFADIGKKWTSTNNLGSISSTGNPFGGPAVSMNGSSLLGKTFTSGQATWIAGMRFNTPSLTAGQILSFDDAASGTQVDLRLTAAGAVQVTRNGTVLGTSAAGLILANTWYHVQFKSIIHASTGTYAVRVNGSAPSGLADATGQNTKGQTASTADAIRFRGVVTAFLACDFYICDATGGVNDDFLGDVRGLVLLPTGAGNYTEWTPLSGSNYTNVDETSANGDTDYNYSSTVNNRDTYVMADLASGYAVKAVQLVGELRKDDAGSRGAALMLRQGSTDVVGTTQSLLDSYLFYTQPYDTDPSDSSAWTAAKVNSLEVGAKIIS